jgi:O-succinylbenzoate synthase
MHAFAHVHAIYTRTRSVEQANNATLFQKRVLTSSSVAGRFSLQWIRRLPDALKYIPKIVNKMSTLLLMAARPTNAWNEYLQTLYTEGQVINFKVPPL